MISNEQIEKQIDNALDVTDFPELGEKYQGKVRDNYTKGGQRVMIVTDRISCFDRVVGTLPFKGQILNQVATFWFEKTKEIVKACLDQGIAVGNFTESLNQTGFWTQQGLRYMSFSVDMGIMYNASRDLVADLRRESEADT